MNLTLDLYTWFTRGRVCQNLWYLFGVPVTRIITFVWSMWVFVDILFMAVRNFPAFHRVPGMYTSFWDLFATELLLMGRKNRRFGGPNLNLGIPRASPTELKELRAQAI